jgi:DEAD/DEAH box helicase domain-containing protein
MEDPFKTFDEIRQAFLRYLDSPFRLRYQALMEERRALLDQDRQLYRRPLFEPIPPYESSGLTIHEACARLGVASEAGDFISTELFPSDRRLYRHQFEAWEQLRAGRAVVVTSATGSGKTECYLIPIFASLVEESSRGWGPPSQQPPGFWWNVPRGERIAQREHEPPERSAALRALFLYPLNALIEDQLGRIRTACDGSSSRAWMNQHRAGHRFWFGRYTGATPVSGLPSNAMKRTELRRRLRRMEQEWRRATAAARQRGDRRVLTYFQDPGGSEMWSRWDMQDQPPDILITNYSMLNIMLMRSVEEDIFEQTKQWLAQDRERHLFHLVVDELHSYRGTPGTEVGYLLRALLDRLDLTPDSPQLRIIATSASIEDDAKSLDYLEQFFGRDPSTFSIIEGHQRAFPASAAGLGGHLTAFAKLEADLEQGPQAAAQAFAAAVDVEPSSDPGDLLNRCLERVGALEAVRRMAEETGPFTVERLAQHLFGSDGEEESSAARGLLRCLVLARTASQTAPLPLRVHYFFHNVGRIWACTNPGCSGRCGSTPQGSDPAPVGRLFLEPRPRCDSCSASVLELLYCQPCGEVFLGGFHKLDSSAPNAWFLSPDYPDLERVPDRSASLARSFGEYMIFWPASGRPLAKRTHAGPAWRWQQDGVQGWQWAPAVLDHTTARLTRPRRAQAPQPGITSGYLFASPNLGANAFASKCPHCGADWVRRRVGSPIRDLGSGFQRVVQLLCDALMREMPAGSGRKLVLFSDSRQDAAKLSTGIKLAHYRDMVRQVAFNRLASQAADAGNRRAAALRRCQQASELLALEQQQQRTGALLQADAERRRTLLADLPPDVSGEVVRFAVVGGPAPAALAPPAPLGRFSAIPFKDLLDSVREGLLDIGLNPGGPRPSMMRYTPRSRTASRAPTVLWHQLFRWDASPVSYSSGLQPVEQQLRDQIEASLRESVIQDVLFADGSRDFESLHLGFLWINQWGPAGLEDEAAASLIRLLAQRRRWLGPEAEGQPQAPQYVDDFLEAVARAAGLDFQALKDRVSSLLGPRLDQWLVVPDRMQLVSARPGPDGRIDIHQCGRCGRSHLHPSAGICTTCRSRLPASPVRHPVDAPAEDYYEFLARSDQQPFPLRCEELTGQTNKDDRISRQRRFQDVFVDDEVALADGVDLLSVTTTMEAGVDIGALQAIALANMPPVRFNYQQRVGRAGRRGLGMAAALTLCRGRSHDDYYFERPRLITAEPPPTPYVDVRRPEIARRVINKEVLRRAFGGDPLPSTGDNVHGEFGTVEKWPQHRPVVQAWIASNTQAIDDICRAVLRRTSMDTSVDRAGMAAQVHNDLLSIIDEVALHRESLPHLALSERMASMGVLPMFGFPTRVRYLFHERPRSSANWPPERGVIDRELEIAISQFAPGAQTVKDDELHTAVGVVDFRPSGPDVAAAPDPLDDPVEVGICRRCQALVPDPAPIGGCPYCSAAQGEWGYRSVDLSEPPGFCTWWSINAEFSGGFEFTPRALRARIGASPHAPTARCNFTVHSHTERVYRINDNDGRDFIFHKIATDNIWISDEAFDQALQDLSRSERAAITAPRHDAAVPPLTRALASIGTTDVLTAGIGTVPVGLCLNPAVPEARAAWYSFGFLVRRAAAVRLDVAESELDIGIQPVMDFSNPFAPPSARVFLSDTLENGAGYSTYLGDPARFEELLLFILGLGSPPDGSFLQPMVDRAHEAECAGSCHRCLREFGNMAYHPLLDWRTAVDMVRLALDPDAQVDLQYSYWATLVDRIAGPYFDGMGLARASFAGLEAGLDQMNNQAVILTHPLWDSDRSNLRSDVAAAVAEAERAGMHAHLQSVLRAVRFPYE